MSYNQEARSYTTNLNTKSTRLARLPDGFWVLAPDTLPYGDELAGTPLQDGFSIEFGGCLRCPPPPGNLLRVLVEGQVASVYAW